MKSSSIWASDLSLNLSLSLSLSEPEISKICYAVKKFQIVESVKKWEKEELGLTNHFDYYKHRYLM